MIRLDRVALREIHLPLVEPFETSAGVVGERRILLLELTDTDGGETWSECVAEALPTYSPDTVDTCWLALSDWIIPLALGQSFAAPSDVHAVLERQVRGHRMARAAVEMGVWALDSKRQGLSLAERLAQQIPGAARNNVAPRSHVETGIAIGFQTSPDALAERCRSALAEGYRRIKIKIAPGRDFEFVQASRDAVNTACSLTVDANCSYTLSDADHVRALENLDTLGLSMIEQPLAHDDLVHHAELQRRLSTRLCLDESIVGEAATEEMIVLGSARVVNLKPGRVGGFQQALAIHDLCAQAGIAVWCGGMLECGIGRAYNVALASLPNFTEPGDLSPSSRYWARDVVKQPWTMDAAGRVRVPLDSAGPGFEVDTGFVDDITVRRASFSAQ